MEDESPNSSAESLKACMEVAGKVIVATNARVESFRLQAIQLCPESSAEKNPTQQTTPGRLRKWVRGQWRRRYGSDTRLLLLYDYYYYYIPQNEC